jgi:hypothetical protein
MISYISLFSGTFNILKKEPSLVNIRQQLQCGPESQNLELGSTVQREMKWKAFVY